MNDLASSVWAAVSKELVPTVLEFSYLQRIHALIFSRLFDWAGQVRDVDTVAGNTVLQGRLTQVKQAVDIATHGRVP